jgi:hypothetical protein
MLALHCLGHVVVNNPCAYEAEKPRDPEGQFERQNGQDAGQKRTKGDAPSEVHGDDAHLAALASRARLVTCKGEGESYDSSSGKP